MDPTDPWVLRRKKIFIAAILVLVVLLFSGLTIVVQKKRAEKTAEIQQINASPTLPQSSPSPKSTTRTPQPRASYDAAFVRDGRVYTFDRKTQKENLLMDRGGQEVHYNVTDSGLAFSASNRYLLWQAGSGTSIPMFDLQSEGSATLFDQKIMAGVLSDTKDLAALLESATGFTKIVDLATRQETLQVKLRAVPLAFSPNNTLLLMRRLKTGQPQEYVYYTFSLTSPAEYKLHTSPNLTATNSPAWLPDSSAIIVNEGDKLTVVPINPNDAKIILADSYGSIIATSPVNKQYQQLIGTVKDNHLALILVNIKNGAAKTLLTLADVDLKNETLRLGFLDEKTSWYVPSKRSDQTFTVYSLTMDAGKSEVLLDNISRFAFTNHE